MMRALPMRAAFTLPFLAFSNLDPQVVLIIGGLIMLGPAVNAWISVVTYCKGQRFDPSLFVTKVELAAHKAERDMQINQTFVGFRDEMRNLRNLVVRLDDHLRQELPGLHRSLGRAEGKIASDHDDEHDGDTKTFRPH